MVTATIKFSFGASVKWSFKKNAVFGAFFQPKRLPLGLYTKQMLQQSILMLPMPLGWQVSSCIRQLALAILQCRPHCIFTRWF